MRPRSQLRKVTVHRFRVLPTLVFALLASTFLTAQSLPSGFSLSTVTGGLGIRYLLARKHGIHMGVDVGFSEEGPALYIQFGSAWLRP